jgi:formylglycine-generating enzyme required for sulfatase activity/predicted small lipoprotein YifL
MRRFLAVLAVVFALAGCGAEKPLIKFVNTPPEATLTADPDTLTLADTSIVTCTVRDPNPDVMTFRWSASSGRFIRRDPTMSQVFWIAPAAEGADTIRVTVFDLSDSVEALVRVVVVGHTGTVLGFVRDETSGEGLADVRLEIAGRTSVSGARGSFRLELVPPGVDTLHAMREGYESFARILSVREGTNELEVPLRRAAPTARLFGTVTNSHSQPVAGATCRVGEAEAPTDTAGRYDLAEVPLGRQELQVRADGYETVRDSVDVQPPEVRRDIVLRAGPPALPRGQLTVTKLGEFRLRVAWVPQDPPQAISSFNLTMIVSGENQGVPQPVLVGSFLRNGGTQEVVGKEDRRYRFAVAAVSVEGVVGAITPYTPVVVLTQPSPLVNVPAGPVIMGSYPGDYGSEVHPGNPVYVQAFAIETQEVTNRQFVAFLVEALAQGQLQVSDSAVHAGADMLLRFDGSQIDRDPLADGFSVPSALKDYPVTGVTWAGADACARWYGRRLPKESEWEKTARGAADSTGVYPGTAVHEGTMYPWGSPPPSGQRASYGGRGKLPVGSFPDGAALWWGTPIYDLAGNVWEWCDDWFESYANPHQPPATGLRKVVRGGAGESTAAELRVGHRWFLEPALVGTKIGFRCAAGPAKDVPD